MPELFGNNPLSNAGTGKFLCLTKTQLFLIKQWADGLFVNECKEWNGEDEYCKDPFSQPPTSGCELDQGVLDNVLGGAFYPGGELGWIMLNPSIYSEPYRICHASYLPGALSLPSSVAGGAPFASIKEGLEPGDLG